MKSVVTGFGYVIVGIIFKLNITQKNKYLGAIKNCKSVGTKEANWKEQITNLATCARG